MGDGPLQDAQRFLHHANSLNLLCSILIDWNMRRLHVRNLPLGVVALLCGQSCVLGYQHKYCIPIFAYPLVCSTITVPVLLELDAIQPADGMACGATSPLWTRLLGYGGLPLLLSIPSFFLSAAAVFHVCKIHRQSPSRNLDVSNAQGGVTPLRPSRTQFLGSRSERATEPTRHLTLQEKRVTRDPTTDEAGPGGVGAEHARIGSSLRVSSWTPTSPSSFPTLLRSGQTEPADVLDSEESTRRQRHSSLLSGPSLAPAIWRLFLFQMAFFFIVTLAVLSPIIDVARHRASPSPFGTQDVALIFTGWGPLIVFGHLPAIKQCLLFWRRRKPDHAYDQRSERRSNVTLDFVTARNSRSIIG